MLFPFSKYKVHGHSMLSTLKEGQEVLTLNWWKILGIKVGDLVVVRHNGREMVKRIQTIVDRHIFVTGDYRQDSMDSRKFGPIKREQIIGKVIWYG